MNDKLETLIVPMDLGEWLDDHKQEFGDENVIFDLANKLTIAYRSQIFHFKTRNFIKCYTTEIWEIIAGNRKYATKTK